MLLGASLSFGLKALASAELAQHSRLTNRHLWAAAPTWVNNLELHGFEVRSQANVDNCSRR